MLTSLEHLKFELLAQGMGLTPAARARLAGADGERPLTLADFATTSGIPLRLPGEIWVNAPVAEHNPNFVRNPPHILDWDPSGFTVRSGRHSFPVQPVPVPSGAQRLNSAGEPHVWYGATHTDRVRISPIRGCANACAFCDLPRTSAYSPKRVDLLVECVRNALADPHLPARHVLISGGTPRPEDRGYLIEAYATILQAFPQTPIDVMMLPLPGLLDVEDLRRKGVHELSVNLELFNENLRARWIPQKARVPLGDWLTFIEHAAGVHGMKVRSLLVVGLEPIEDTLRAVEALAERGCEPVLSPFRPAPGTPLESAPPPPAELMVDVFLRAREVAARHGGKLGPKCLPCQHNTLTLPDGSDYYHA